MCSRAYAATRSPAVRCPRLVPILIHLVVTTPETTRAFQPRLRVPWQGRQEKIDFAGR